MHVNQHANFDLLTTSQHPFSMHWEKDQLSHALTTTSGCVDTFCYFYFHTYYHPHAPQGITQANKPFHVGSHFMLGPPHRKSLLAPPTRVMQQTKQMLLDEMQCHMMKSKMDKTNVTPRRNGGPDPTKSKSSNAMAESTDASPNSNSTPESPAPAE